MEQPKPRIQLDKMEIGLVFSLFILVAGMMFTLGVLVGHGVGVRDSGSHLAASTQEAMSGLHGGGHADTSHDQHDSPRKPASVEGAKTAAAPGADLRKAFRDSKQQALVEMALRENSPAKAKSAMDAEAHLNAHPEWNRKPASTDEDATDEKAKELEMARKAEEAREKGGVPRAVKSLFERKPANADAFTPRSGSYTIQISSYATADEGAVKVSELRRSGFNDAYAETIRLKNGESWHRVGVGSFPNADWARKNGDKIVKRGLAHDYVVRQVP